MLMDVLPIGKWEQLNSEIATILGVPATCSVRVYNGLAAAIYEVTTGLNQFFMHKKQLACVQNQGPSFDFLMPHLYRDNFQMQTFTGKTEWAAWVAELKADTNYVLLERDHPATAQMNVTDAQIASLLQKKIFTIEVVHHVWPRWAKAQKWDVQPMQIQILNVTPELAIVVSGPRFKAPPIVAPAQAWDADRVKHLLKTRLETFGEDEDLVRAFESALPSGWSGLVHTTERVWDRACISHAQLSGDAILQNLQQVLGSLDADTADLCKWNQAANFFKWWSATDQQLRGSLILSLSALRQPDFKKQLELAAQASSWS